MKRGRPQAKDIPVEPVLGLLMEVRATWFEDAPNSVLSVMPAGTPPKVALAKMRALHRQGLVDGCPCGCRGDFTLTVAGMAELARLREALPGT